MSPQTAKEPQAASSAAPNTNPAHEQIAALAYRLWQARGCPENSSEEDWFEAEVALAAAQPEWEKD